MHCMSLATASNTVCKNSPCIKTEHFIHLAESPPKFETNTVVTLQTRNSVTVNSYQTQPPHQSTIITQSILLQITKQIK